MTKIIVAITHSESVQIAIEGLASHIIVLLLLLLLCMQPVVCTCEASVYYTTE